MKKLSQLPAEKREALRPFFTIESGKKVNEIQVDETWEVIAIGYTCTRTDCNCGGGWWEKTGANPYGEITHITNE